jgi:hypothetical protein
VSISSLEIESLQLQAFLFLRSTTTPGAISEKFRQVKTLQIFACFFIVYEARPMLSNYVVVRIENFVDREIGR